MSIENHLDALKRKHGALDAKLAEQLARPIPDQEAMTRLKREKLKLKEEIEKLGGETHH